ncbi:alpha/beta hydrolase family protein [Flexivirga caeni]|uniref:Alpha/beta hydrolase n=1 Tax=Flexivirga caeni TaxID=2294115 RepID=A0A3M9LYD4_9MICO|nr:alpha/beta hydrolase [Flexivirga caeni]RNI18291.1 alpha/beta hydrolase [Flexivirga caeni]
MSVLSMVAPPPDRTTSYGPDDDQVYDVRLPAAASRDATVIVIHGGFWRPSYDRGHAGPQSTALAAHGFHVATIEYRRIPGDWPAMAADVLAAIHAVASDPALPDDIVLLGHSAGGHLAAWSAHQGVPVIGFVSLAGCLDLHMTRDLGLGGDAAAELMGAASETVWRAADPAMLGRPPVRASLVHGDADDRVPVEVSESYQAAVGAGVPLQVLAGCAHFELIDPRSAYFTHTVTGVGGLLS